MSWLDPLKKIFPKLTSLVTFNININSNNRNEKVKIDASSKNVSINLEKLTPKEEGVVKSVLAEAVNENKLLLQDKSKLMLEDFELEDKSEKTKEIISFLTPLISQEDLIVWRASLYLKKCFQEGKSGVAILKSQLSQKYGDRGNNIANLCTAGYLEEYLIPMHEALKKSIADAGKVKERFQIFYATIVNDLPFTIFVCAQMHEGEIKKTILDKMEQNMKYGLKFFNIHGIGTRNIKKIKEVLAEIENKKILANKNITEGNDIIFVRLEFA